MNHVVLGSIPPKSSQHKLRYSTHCVQHRLKRLDIVLVWNCENAQLTSFLARTADEALKSFPMDQDYYRSASNSLQARTADRTPKMFALQGDPSRPTHSPSSKRSSYIVFPASRDVAWNDLAHS
ncbi:hypothetical protein AVEN_247936-1 [Araneus ventricosus]|uniref:Uncharacterized protein n=1 Tax=Araneus ventricosus TaxID=182803 RepID=A0A4Y2CI72_ARAVE|nr:hypothetical protein AVEN_247936-1 [Araneus ventricosus]